VLVRFAGQPADHPTDDTITDNDTVASTLALYRATSAQVDEVIAAASLDDRAQPDDLPRVNLRWILAHLLEETARHAGHADILRGLYDGATGR
jgi:hypothetical protein